MRYEAPVSAGLYCVSSMCANVRLYGGDVHVTFFCSDKSVLSRVMLVFERRELPHVLKIQALNVYVAPHKRYRFDNAIAHLQTLGFMEPSLGSQLVLECSRAFDMFVLLEARRAMQKHNRLAFVSRANVQTSSGYDADDEREAYTRG